MSVPNDGIDALGQEGDDENHSAPVYGNLLDDFDDQDDEFVPLEDEEEGPKPKCVLLETAGEDHADPNIHLNADAAGPSSSVYITLPGPVNSRRRPSLGDSGIVVTRKRHSVSTAIGDTRFDAAQWLEKCDSEEGIPMDGPDVSRFSEMLLNVAVALCLWARSLPSDWFSLGRSEHVLRSQKLQLWKITATPHRDIYFHRSEIPSIIRYLLL